MTGNRAFYIYAVLFAAGTLGAQLSPVLIRASLLAVAGPALLACFAVRSLRPVVVLLAGVAWSLLRADLILGVQWPPALEGRDAVVAGTVAGLPQRDRRYLKFDFDVDEVRRNGRAVRGAADFHARVRIRWYGPSRLVQEELKAGSRWRLTVRLKRPHGYYNPGGFDYEAYLFRKHIRATGYVRKAPGNRRLAGARGLSFGRLRQTLHDRLDASLRGLHHGGLLRALAIGDRSGISNREWDTLRATGTTHLMAISGLHIGFAAGIGALLGLWLGGLLALRRTGLAAPRVGAVCALCLAAAYAGLSGFAVPAQRAFIMAAVFLLGVLCARRAWNVRGLCLALLAVLIIDPVSVRAPGFWLSFCAVGFILGWLGRKPGSERQGRSRRDRILETVKLQWVLSLVLLPLVALFFGSVSTVSGPANMLAVPVVMFAVVPPCLLGTVLAAFGWQAGASGCLAAGDRVLDLLWPALTWLGHLRYASVALHLALWQSLALLAGAGWVVLARPGRRSWGLMCAAVLLAPGPARPHQGRFRLTVLDVGQGLSAVVETRHHTLVYDTGPRYPGGFSLAKAAVMPYLHWRSLARIDTLVISHGDNDHRGGFEDLRAAFSIGRILSSVAGDLPRARYCVAGQRWTWDDVAFEILHPAVRHPPPDNNSSCVLKVTGRYGSALLTGDIEARAESSLRRRWGGKLASDVLLVPHQGSATSSTASFIDLVNPRWAIVSAGYLNRYGHPRPEVVARYRRRRIPVLNTAYTGAVIVDFPPSGLKVHEWRRERPRYWLATPAPHSHDTIWYTLPPIVSTSR